MKINLKRFLFAKFKPFIFIKNTTTVLFILGHKKNVFENYSICIEQISYLQICCFICRSVLGSLFIDELKIKIFQEPFATRVDSQVKQKWGEKKSSSLSIEENAKQTFHLSQNFRQVSWLRFKTFERSVQCLSLYSRMSQNRHLS